MLLVVTFCFCLGSFGKKYIGATQDHRHTRVVSAALARGYSSSGFQMSWSPLSSCLAVPSSSLSVLLYSKSSHSDSWNEQTLVTDQESSDLQHSSKGNTEINIVSFSPNGSYLLSADTAGIILIWDVETKSAFRKISCIDHDTKQSMSLFDIKWGPNVGDNYLVILSATSWGEADNIISAQKSRGPSIVASAAGLLESDKHVVSPESTSGSVGAEVPVQSSVSTTPLLPKSFKDAILAASDQNVNSNSGSKLKRVKKLGGKDGNNDEDDEDDLLFANIESTSVTAAPDSNRSVNIATIKGDIMRAPKEDDDRPLEDQEPVSRDGPFQLLEQDGGITSYIHGTIEPSSTPFDEKRRRYMMWNQVGTITCRYV